MTRFSSFVFAKFITLAPFNPPTYHYEFTYFRPRWANRYQQYLCDGRAVRDAPQTQLTVDFQPDANAAFSRDVRLVAPAQKKFSFLFRISILFLMRETTALQAL